MSEDLVRAKAGQFLTFNISGRPYGVPIVVIREINHVKEITPVPQTDEHVIGVINLRGKVIPVIDLKLKFGMGKTVFTKETCTVVFEGPNGQVGAVVDSVSDVLELAQSQIEAPPVMADHDLTFIMGMGKINEKVIILIDIVEAITRSASGHRHARVQDRDLKASVSAA